MPSLVGTLCPFRLSPFCAHAPPRPGPPTRGLHHAIQDGNYLDRQTRELTMEVLTFNAELHVFVYVRLAFTWHVDGSVSLQPQLLSLPALTYLRAGEGGGGGASWSRVASAEFAGLWVVTLVFVAVTALQAVRAWGAFTSRDLTLRQVRWDGEHGARPDGRAGCFAR